MKLLLIVNTPPPYQGTTIMNRYLLDTLEEKSMGYIHLRIDSSKDLRALGRPELAKFRSALNIVRKIFTVRKEYRAAYLVMSVEGFAFYRHSLFILLLLLLKKNCILHLRGLGFRNKKGFGKILTSFIFKRCYLIQHSAYNSFDIERYTSKKVFYVPNGWEDYHTRFKEQIDERISDTSGNVNILFLSNLIADKGLFTVLESIRIINSDPACQGINTRWNFIGNWESEATRQEFLDFVDKHSLGEKIGFVGPLYNEEKYAFIARMNILVFPTFYKHETWGNVILEAMMFKIPVIATNYVAIPEMVKDSKTGFLINREDPQALAEKTITLVRDRQKRNEMGCAGRSLFLQLFTLDTFKENIIRVLQTVNP
ncbi:MAG TPA: glycosyltransferase family 4 protein [Chitinophagaceae bacterium]|jgi:glycosyltransferase involved in cell wall biosynthesis|nr:glycosyltransferase family 4 protein [Chitinophagaceae bacterium]